MKKLVGIMFCGLLLAGCAGTTQYVPLPNQQNVVDEPSKARIYVIRPTVFGGAVAMKVSDNGKVVGKTYGKSFISWEREPGMFTLTGKAENEEVLPLSVKAGERIYIKQSVEMGILMARNSLGPLDEPTAKEYLAKFKPPKVKLNQG